MNPIVRLVLTFGLMWSLGGGPASAAVVVKLGHDQPEKSPHHEGALKWRELVESRFVTLAPGREEAGHLSARWRGHQTRF